MNPVISSISIAGNGIECPESDCVDVVLTLNDGKRYAATFTTLRYLSSLFTKNETTGECCSGTYLCVSHMIIVNRLSIESIERSLLDLFNEGEHERILERLN